MIISPDTFAGKNRERKTERARSVLQKEPASKGIQASWKVPEETGR